MKINLNFRKSFYYLINKSFRIYFLSYKIGLFCFCYFSLCLLVTFSVMQRMNTSILKLTKNRIKIITTGYLN